MLIQVHVNFLFAYFQSGVFTKSLQTQAFRQQDPTMHGWCNTDKTHIDLNMDQMDYDNGIEETYVENKCGLPKSWMDIHDNTFCIYIAVILCSSADVIGAFVVVIVW